MTVLLKQGVSEILTEDAKRQPWLEKFEGDDTSKDNKDCDEYIARLTIQNQAKDNNTLIIPSDLSTKCKRIHSLIIKGARASKMIVKDAGQETGALMYTSIFNEADAKAKQAHLELFQSGNKEDKAAVDTVLEFMQGLQFTVELDKKNKNPGYLFIILIMMQEHRLKVSGTSVKKTAKDLGQQKLREEVLMNFKRIFTNGASAERILILAEIVMRNLYRNVFELGAATEQYIKKAEELVRPSLTKMFQRHTRTGTKHHAAILANKKQKVEGVDAWDEAIPAPPVVRCDDNFVADVTTIEDVAALKVLNVAVAHMRGAEQMSLCNHVDICAQDAQAKSYVYSLYAVQDKVKRVLQSRRDAINEACLQECRDTFDGKDVKMMYAPYNKMMFQRNAKTFMATAQNESIWKDVSVGTLGMTTGTEEDAKERLLAYIKGRLETDLEAHLKKVKEAE